ncbi:zinc finger and SCAN domain-containing protein 16 isoform X6 [Bicyclus anynana]|uniref:Zinc finger and SCAN domain-containing protein 16 isoform X6 n=1 Tax=Bicyclus anynana TaxID=110368 RepID=A0A6J1MW76_BICAN|nr:zinc finger and SCAN domain-containing protein 16 isoform X6 [Bicyclus anynana]
MAAKTWKIEKDLCRCCHAEGTFDNLAEPRTFLEKEEVYTDMLRECLDVDIPPVPGELCAITYTICTACITRLRDACNFKKQVQDCEQRFMTMYYKNAIQGVKPETVVKEELEVSLELQQSEDEILVLKKEEDDDDEDALMDFTNDDDDLSDDFPIKRPTTSTKTRSKAKPKPKPSPVKKEKPPPKKKVEAKPVKEKKGEVIEGCVVTVGEDGTKRFSCEVCGKTFNQRKLFSQHYLHVHLKKRPKLRGCHLCEIKVPGHLRAFHMEECHGLPAPCCGACDKKFAFPWQLLQHQKFYHMGEADYRCEPCNLSFIRRSKYMNHLIKHGDLKAYKCEICDKSFKWRSGLRTHMLIHKNIRRHVCNICLDSFVQQSSLKYHVMKKHPNMV